MDRRYCCVCGRQIVSYDVDDDNRIGGHPVVLMGYNQYCCHVCAKDLDENGMWPEEN